MHQRLDPAELDALWDFSDLRASHRQLTQALEDAEGTRRDELRTQVARALGLLGDMPGAHEELDAIRSEDPVLRQRVDLERGRLFATGGPAVEAAPCLERARDLDADEFLTVDAHHMLAIVDGDHSAQHTDAGLARARASKDQRVRRWEGALLNNHGWNLVDRGQLVEALAVFKKAERWFAEHGTPEQAAMAHETVQETAARLMAP